MPERKRPDDMPGESPDPEDTLKELAALAGPFLKGLLADAISARDRAKVEEELAMDRPSGSGPGYGLSRGNTHASVYARPLFVFQAGCQLVLVMDDGTTRVWDDDNEGFLNGPTIPGSLRDMLAKAQASERPDLLSDLDLSDHE